VSGYAENFSPHKEFKWNSDHRNECVLQCENQHHIPVDIRSEGLFIKSNSCILQARSNVVASLCSKYLPFALTRDSVLV